MGTRYSHDQVGRTLLVALSVGFLGVTVAASLIRLQPGGVASSVVVPASLVLPLCALVVVALLFWRMRITVDAQNLRWEFGVGLLRFSQPLAQIARAEATQTRWYEGMGIHRTRRGWLYNVAGGDAVLVHRIDGSSFMLGSDDARALIRTLGRGVEPSGRNAR